MKTKEKKQPGVIRAIGVLMTILFKLVGYMKDIYGKLPLMDFIERVGADFYRLGTAEGKDTLKQIAELITGAANKIQEKAEVILGNFRRTVELVLEPYEPPTKGLTLKDVIKQILPIKEEGGVIDWRDPDLENWFGNEPVKTRKERISSYIYRFLTNLANRQIIAEAEQQNTYQCYDIVDAIKLVAQAIAKGEVNTRNSGIVIYLKNKYQDTFCRLGVCRLGVGELIVDVFKVDLDNEWDAASGACFRGQNQSL